MPEPATHCKRGHERTPENTKRRNDGAIECRVCRRKRQKEYRANGRRPRTLVTNPDSAGALLYTVRKDGKHVPMWRYRVEPFQRALDMSGMSRGAVEMKCGWGRTMKNGRVQGTGYLTRLLGYRPRSAGTNGVESVAQTLNYDNAYKIAHALGLDLVWWEI